MSDEYAIVSDYHLALGGEDELGVGVPEQAKNLCDGTEEGSIWLIGNLDEPPDDGGICPACELALTVCYANRILPTHENFKRISAATDQPAP